MTQVVGVRFKDTGKVYFFDPNGLEIKAGSHVIVETARGVECGIVAEANKSVEDDEVVAPLKPVKRIATQEDMNVLESNKKKEKEAYNICVKKIEDHKLDMNLTEVEYTFDGSKIIFYFTADGRVDFRELVKDLASAFHSRIELRQIGVRDESKMIGGLGICGRPFCCSTFLNDFHSVSIKMAKEQGLSLSPGKISGTCGRLMCCLKYEQNSYDYLQKITPRKGAIVDCRDGRGTVVDVSLLTGKLKIKLNSNPDGAPVVAYRDEVVVVKEGRHQSISKQEAELLKQLEKN
ncbi:MAG: stage 0 sporulation family protein [Eubacterium sp.]|nr:stage 0 sporulation family protein [Eubacterium sp.]MDE7124161.1 stage 0 sporulation family protein [Eubacterium sp.]